jgi:hypothetical protein
MKLVQDSGGEKKGKGGKEKEGTQAVFMQFQSYNKVRNQVLRGLNK